MSLNGTIQFVALPIADEIAIHLCLALEQKTDYCPGDGRMSETRLTGRRPIAELSRLQLLGLNLVSATSNF